MLGGGGRLIPLCQKQKPNGLLFVFISRHISFIKKCDTYIFVLLNWIREGEIKDEGQKIHEYNVCDSTYGMGSDQGDQEPEV